MITGQFSQCLSYVTLSVSSSQDYIPNPPPQSTSSGEPAATTAAPNPDSKNASIIVRHPITKRQELPESIKWDDAYTRTIWMGGQVAWNWSAWSMETTGSGELSTVFDYPILLLISLAWQAGTMHLSVNRQTDGGRSSFPPNTSGGMRPLIRVKHTPKDGLPMSLPWNTSSQQVPLTTLHI